MARFKVFAHHTLIGAAIVGFFAASSGIAYRAAGAAVHIGSYFGGR